MHSQHLGEAAVGKRKLTWNINSQILKCASVAAWLALGMSLAKDCWEAAVLHVWFAKGELWGISHKSARQKMNEFDNREYGKEMNFASMHIKIGCILCM